jgi:hypothetical protein
MLLPTRRAREHAEVDLGQSELAGALLGDQDVRGHGDLEAAADRVPLESGDDQLGRLLQAVQRLVGVQAEVVLEVRVGRLQHVDVGAGAEELVAFALQNDHVHVLVEPGLENAVVELTHHLVRIGIGRRVVEGDVGDPFSDLVVNQGALGRGRFRDSRLSHLHLLPSSLRYGEPARWHRYRPV